MFKSIASFVTNAVTKYKAQRVRDGLNPFEIRAGLKQEMRDREKLKEMS